MMPPNEECISINLSARRERIALNQSVIACGASVLCQVEKPERPNEPPPR
jgi:hypothetical protein